MAKAMPNKPTKKTTAWRRVTHLFGWDAQDEERPMNPGLVAKEWGKAEPLPPEELGHEERVHRIREQNRLNESPRTTWPG